MKRLIPFLMPIMLYCGGEDLTEIVIHKPETTLEFYEIAVSTIFSDSPHSYQIIRPFIEKEVKRNGNAKKYEENLHELIIQATKEAIIEQQKQLEIEKLKKKNRYTKKKTAVITSICSLSATIITTSVALIIHFSSK